MIRWLLKFLITTALFVALAGPATAASHGDWYTGVTQAVNVTGQELAYGGTRNDSRQFFGMVCANGHGCEWRITIRSSCTVNNTCPALMSSPAGAASVTLRCLGTFDSGASYWYSVTEESLVLTAVLDKQAGYIGFVTPQDGGQFTVMRFSRVGAQSALGEAMRLAEKLSKSPSRPTVPADTKDTLL